MSDRSMKFGSVVVMPLAKFDEVFASLGNEVAVKFEVEVAVVSNQPHVALLLYPGVSENNLISLKYLI